METIEYEIKDGIKIKGAVEKMVKLAKEKNSIVISKFWNIKLTAKPDSLAEDIVNYYWEKIRKEREGPESIQYLAEQEKEVSEMQKLYDNLLLQLPNLDFNNDHILLDWLCQLQDPSSDSRITKQANLGELVLSTFSAHNYYPDVNCEEALNQDDRDNLARYIIGQALSCLQTYNSIPQIIDASVDRWKKKFITITQ